MKILEIFQEANGMWSMRRVLAFISLLAGIVLAYFSIAGAAGWFSFAPSYALFIVSIFMLFFTTWQDLGNAINAVKKIKEKRE
jgi:hypothetical protein